MNTLKCNGDGGMDGETREKGERESRGGGGEKERERERERERGQERDDVRARKMRDWMDGMDRQGRMERGRDSARARKMGITLKSERRN